MRYLTTLLIFLAAMPAFSQVKALVGGTLIDGFGGKPLPIMTHLIESGRLTDQEVREARKALRRLTRKEKRK